MNIRSFSQQERDRAKKMWAQDGEKTDLYADRQSAKTEAERRAAEEANNFVVDESDEALEELLSEARGDWNCFRCCRRRTTGGEADAEAEANVPKDKNA